MNQKAFIKVDKATFFRFIANAPDNERYEYVRGRIVQQQPGGTWRHADIARRFARIIEEQIGEERWSVLSGSDRGVETERTVRYPDVVVEPSGAPADSQSTRSPAILVEVLSPSSEERDLTAKPDEYLALTTLQAYIVAEQEAPDCLVWLRGANGAFPAEPVRITGRDATIAVPQLGVTIPLANVYRGM